MNRTQNDLSLNKTQLDYQAMLTTSQVAYGRCTDRICKYLNDCRDWSLNPSSKSAMLPYLSAEWLEIEAKHLTIVAETMYTLQQGLSRQELVIVNKPEVKDE